MLRKALFSLFLLSLLPLAALASEAEAEAVSKVIPRAVIAGPDDGIAGEMVVFEATDSSGKSFDWVVLPEVLTHRGEGGKSISLGTTQPGTYYIVLIATEGDHSSKAVHVFRNGGIPNPNPPGPEPGPGPGPGPDPVPPTPPTPEPENWLQNLQKAAKTSVDMMPQHLDKTYVRQHIALALRECSKAIRAGQYKTDREIVAAQQRFVRLELGDATADSLREWGGWLGNQLQKSKSDGHLSTPTGFADAYDAIASGLDP